MQLPVLHECCTILLNHGYNALIDAADFAMVSQYRWRVRVVYPTLAYA